MIFSRANLLVKKVASKDRFFRALNGVLFEVDGCTVGSDGNVLMAVGPADEKKAQFPERAGEQYVIGSEGLVMPLDSVDKALKLMPRDKRVILQHGALTKIKDASRVGFTSIDVKGDPTTNSAIPKNEPYPDWKKIVRSIRGSGIGMRVCLNRKSMINLLSALDEACPDKGGTSPVFLEISDDGDGVLFRCINHLTGQHALGAMTLYDTKGKWLERDKWEQKVFNIVRRMKQKIKVGKKKRKRIKNEQQ